ncbi:MAG: hypothetical protein ACREQV_07175 [Candidatus Binatia bacterium]
MKTLYRRLPFSLLIAWAIAACGGGLQRDQTANWEDRSFESAKVEINLPKGARVRDSESGLLIQLHRMPPPSGIMADSHYLVEVGVQRLSAADYQDRIAFNRESPKPETSASRWLGAPHDIVSKRGEEFYSSFRYDVHCRTGDVLWADANLTHYYVDGVSQFGEEDEATIRRILASIKCLD